MPVYQLRKRIRRPGKMLLQELLIGINFRHGRHLEAIM
jgi:hypothetical protein